MDLDAFQQAVASWHADKFPGARTEHIALKLAEEAGEVCRAVVESSYPSRSGHGRESLADELADVLIVLMALATKYEILVSDAAETRLGKILAR